MKNFINLVFDIVPITGGKLTVFRCGNRLIPSKSKNAKDYSLEVRELAKVQWGKNKPLDCPLKIDVVFYIPRPKTIKKRKYPHTKPDLDNLEKQFFDALEGVIFTNDSRIVTKTSSKMYAMEGRIELKIRVLK